MMDRLPKFILFLTSILMILAPANATVKSVFIFGDSLFDPGNNRWVKNCSVQANFPPYGLSFFHRPTGRFTNGRTVADFIARFMGIKFQSPFQEVYRRLTKGTMKGFPANGINFASAGSGVLTDTNKNTGVTPIQVQLKQFQSLIDKKYVDKNLIKNSMFFFESGSNDIFTYFLSSDKRKLPPIAYVPLMLKEVAHFIHTIHKLGARRIAIFSVGPMGCIPGRVLLPNTTIDRCFHRANKMVKYYNYGLERLVYTLPIRYPGTIGVYGAVYDIVERVRANPEVHGFTHINEACCGAGPLNGRLQCGIRGFKMCMHPNKYFFWDYFHPTERTYKILSNDLWAGSKNQIRPMNLKALANFTLPFS